MASIDNKQFYKTVARVTIPIALQSLVSSSLTLLDNLMVSSLSETALSSVNQAVQVFHVQWLMIFGLCTGCSTFYTQFWGVRDMKNIRKVAGLAVTACSVLSLAFFFAGLFFPTQVISLITDDPEARVLGATYLRVAAVNFPIIAIRQPLTTALSATQQTSIPLKISLCSFFTDVVFNYLLIFGNFGFPEMGVAGAALATVLARLVELAMTLYFIFVKKNIIAGKLSEFFAFDKVFAKRVFRNCVPTTLNETLWSIAVACTASAYGHMDITSYASNAAATSITDLFTMASFSVGDASLILIGERLGRREPEEAKEISRKLLKLGLAVGAISALMILFASRPVVGFFNLSPLGEVYARKIIIIRGCMLPITLTNVILVCGVLRAGGDTKFAAIAECSLMYLIQVPISFIGALVLEWPIYIIILCTQLENLVKILILGRRYLSGKWVNNVIHDM